MTKSNKKYIKREDSKQPLKNFSWTKTDGTVFPNFSFDAVLALIESDPVARGAINHFTDKCMEGDYSIIRREDRDYDRLAELRLEEKYMFRTKILRKVFLMGKLFNNVFIEIVRDTDGKTKALNVLDSTQIDVITEPNGDPVSYKSKIPNPVTGEHPTWDNKEVTWIKFGDRTDGWAPVDMRALFENLQIKQYVKRYVGWLWKTGQYRLMYNFNKASNQDIEDFLTYARKNDGDFKIPFVAKGEVKTELLRDMREIGSLVEMLKYLDSQTLILLRIPPIDAGIPDASGRSNADAQANNIESTVVAWKKVTQDYINYDLFPKINKSTYMIQFGPMNRFAIKQFFGLAGEMISMGMSEKSVKEFLQDWGIHFETKTLFKPRNLDAISGAFNGKSNDEESHEAKKDPGEGNKPKTEPTTREDQLHKTE